MPELVVDAIRIDCPFSAESYPFLIARQAVSTHSSWWKVNIATGATFLCDKLVPLGSVPVWSVPFFDRRKRFVIVRHLFTSAESTHQHARVSHRYMYT